MRLVDSRLDDWSGVPSVFLPNAPINQSSNHRCDRRLGFTLVELMTVIAIIGILAGLILGIAGYAARKADRSKAIAELEKIKGALEEYRLEFGAYPSLAGPLTNAVFNAVRNRLTNSMRNAVTDLQFIDPWGNGYEYKQASDYSYALWSVGANSLDAGDDISSEMGGM